MVKRVKRGLPPVPTEAEERDRIRRLRAEDKETQDELAGMIYKRKEEKEVPADIEEEEEEEEADNDDEADDDDDVIVDMEENEKEENLDREQEQISEVKVPLKKKARSKPVPDGYECYACKNEHSPLHWIYDCPAKIRNPGTNKVSKKLRGVHDPSSRKVFLSGLPFDVKSKDVKQYFEKDMKCGKVLDCKLLVFDDTKRCKGTGFLTFESDEAANKALKLNGTPFNMEMDEEKKPKKQLTLNVKKVLNRTQTKK
jgi:RNA recognition motif-containing protein